MNGEIRIMFDVEAQEKVVVIGREDKNGNYQSVSISLDEFKSVLKEMGVAFK